MAKERLDRVTRIACSALTAIESYGLEIPEDARAWWEVHKEQDAKREREAEEVNERIRTRLALLEDIRSRVSDDEWEILGFRP
jgi:glycerate-2-kinase